MRVEVDQSGKIGEAGTTTALAFTDGIARTLVLKSSEKSKLVRDLKAIKNRDAFYFRLYAYLLFRLVEADIETITQLCIDDEYPGRYGEIKGYFLDILRTHGIVIDPAIIHFLRVGKASRVHTLAITAHRTEVADIVVSYEDVMEFFIPPKKGSGLLPVK